MKKIVDLLRQIPLSLRISAAPYLVLALAAILFFLAEMQGRQALKAIDAIHQEAALRRALVGDLLALSYRVHSDVSRHLALVDSGTSEAKLADIRKAIDTEMGMARARVEDLKKGAAAGDIAADIDARLTAYAKAVAQMNDMAESDRLIAIPLMSHVDKQFQELAGRVAAAQEQVAKTADDEAAATREANSAAGRRMWLWSAAALLVFVALTSLVVRSITGPLKHLVHNMTALSAGRLDTVVDGTDSRDEVGDMARALAVFKDNAVEAERLRAEQSRLSALAEQEKRRALGQMAETVETESGAAVNRVAEHTQAMSLHAGDMQAAAQRVLDKATTVAAAAEQSLANAQTVASAAEQLSSSIGEIGTQVTHSADVTRKAVETAGDAQHTLAALTDAVARIGDVVKLISDIAAQTNLLALNATIEAARAGEAGRGFAVVANEVKNLASDTARSTEEITRQIGEIKTVTTRTVSSVQAVIDSISEIQHISDNIAAAIEEQGAATQEIARNIVETSAAAQQVSDHIGEVSREASGTGTQAQEVRAIAGDVAGSVESLRHVLVDVVKRSLEKV